MDVHMKFGDSTLNRGRLGPNEGTPMTGKGNLLVSPDLRTYEQQYSIAVCSRPEAAGHAI